MPNSTRRPVDPYAFFPRLVRFVIGLAVLVGVFSGAKAAPRSGEMTQGQIEAQLENADGPLRTFVALLENSIRSGRIADAESFVDRDAILDRATKQVSIKGDQTVRDLFCDSTRRAWDERGVTRDYAGSRFTFMRARTLGGRAGLLFRSSTHDGGVNYALFTLNQVKPGDYRISDIFVVGLNEFLSDTLRRTWVNVAASLLGDEASGLEGVNPEYVANIASIAEMSRQLQAGKAEEVLNTGRALPESVQKARTVMLMRIDAAERVSPAERDAAFALWLSVYPDEMDLPLKFAHFYTTRQRWEDAERVMRNLLAKLGDDAMLKMELGSILYRKEHSKNLASAAGLSR
jgi:hypothetical protein